MFYSISIENTRISFNLGSFVCYYCCYYCYCCYYYPSISAKLFHSALKRSFRIFIIHSAQQLFLPRFAHDSMRSDIRNLSEIRANYLYRSRRGGKRRGFIGFFWLECRLIFRANNGIREISIGVGVFGWIHVGRRTRICESMIYIR